MADWQLMLLLLLLLLLLLVPCICASRFHARCADVQEPAPA
jgi:hypothetical protein